MIRKLAVLGRTSWYEMMEYRAESLIWMFAAFAQPLVTLAVWWAVAGDGTINGMDRGDFVHYFLALLICERLTRAWVTWEIEQQIRLGTLSGYLVRPINPVWHHLLGNLVYKVFCAAILIPGLLITAQLWPMAKLPLDLTMIPVVFLAIMVGGLIRFLMSYCIGLLAFWTTQSLAIFTLIDLIMYFLGGRIAPLSVMPEVVIAAARWLPFRAMAAFPVELLAGQITERSAVMEGLLLQAGWLVIFLILFRILWRSGLKAYGAVGG